MSFIRPCIGRLTSPFGYRTHPITGKRLSFHQGIDIAQSGNVPIYAAASGTVTRVGRLGTYGNVVMIVHNINGRTFETNYAHLKSYSVRVGQRVSQGQRIAYMGNTGNSTGQHLHFEIHNGRWATGQPNAVDPLKHIVLVPSLGAIGSDVENVQRLLVNHGHKLKVDGHFGRATDKALEKFQRDNRLTVDGMAGPATITKLTNAPVVKPAAPKPTSKPPQKPKEKEVDSLTKYMDEILPGTQQKDAADLFKKAHEDGYFSVNHAPKAKSMTRRQYYDLKTSLDIREKLNKKFK